MKRIQGLKFAILIVTIASALFACSGGKSTDTPPEKENIGAQIPDLSLVLDSLTIGSVNMTVGWNAEDLITKDLEDSSTVYSALKKLHTQFVESQPSRRMRVIAAAMIAHPVDVMALQEVQVMRAGDTAEFHFVDTLLLALRELGDQSKWTVIRQMPMNQITLDVHNSAGQRMNIDFWEGNVLLVREAFAFADTLSEIFDASVPFHILGDEIRSTRGYIRATIRSPRGGKWQIFNTHLEVELLGVFTTPQGFALNAAAWDEWQGLENATQIVIGDLNSKPGLSAAQILTNEGTGLVDLWQYAQGDTIGWTCCIPDLGNPEVFYNRRIDYILARNYLDASVIERIPLFVNGFWGGDHAMLRATVRRQRERVE